MDVPIAQHRRAQQQSVRRLEVSARRVAILAGPSTYRAHGRVAALDVKVIRSNVQQATLERVEERDGPVSPTSGGWWRAGRGTG